MYRENKLFPPLHFFIYCFILCATSKFSLYNMWTYIVYYHLTGAQWHKYIKTERSSGVRLIEATSSLTRKICTCIPRSQLNFLSWRVFRHFQPLCRFETVIYLFIDLDICQGGGFATPSGVIREAIFAKSTKIDGVEPWPQIKSSPVWLPFLPFCKRGQLPYDEGHQHWL